MRRNIKIERRLQPNVLFGLIVIISLFASCGGNFPTLYRGDKDARLVRFGSELNSSEDDYAPVILPDGNTIVFTSNRPHGGTTDRNDDVYRSLRSGERWGTAERIDVSVGKDLNEGSLSFDYAHNRIYFSQCYLPDGVGDCDLYAADIRNGKWENVHNVGVPINSKEWDAHPSIARDGKTLFYSSWRYGGRGESDIWMATRQPDGTWSAPVNLGEVINTAGDERSPMISADGMNLYFASNNHAGFGGFDIFRSTKTETGWTRPINLGMPYNSETDDLFFTTTPSEDTSFVSSNRKGSLGGLDLYQVIRIREEVPPPPPPVIKPLILHLKVLNAFTNEPVVATVVLATPRENDLTLETDKAGETAHEIRPGAKYSITTLAAGYKTGDDVYQSSDIAQGDVEKTILLTPVREAERVIYKFRVEFDFDKFHIRPEEQKHLDSVVTLLTKYPKSVVVVSGHTDSVGTVQYNMILGFNRAKRVSDYVGEYLHERGVRLHYPLDVRSYGKSEPVETNETEEGRQRNRRVEISIVRYE